MATAGHTCTDYGVTAGYTFVDKGYPATGSGSVEDFSVYIQKTGTSDPYYLQVAFFTASGNNLTSQNGATVEIDSPLSSRCEEWVAGEDFTAFEVESGEYPGFYTVSGAVAHVSFTDGDGGGIWYKSGDYIPCSGEAFTLDGDSNGITSMVATITEAGGETYNESISEKINLADSERAGMIYGLGISESFRLGESMGPRTVLNVSRTDSINLIDAIKASLIYAMRVGEAISLRDIQVTEAIIPLQISEGITLSDSVKGQFVFSPRLSDRFSLADAITAGFLFYLPLNEVISLTDSLIIELVGGAQIFNESLTEKISIAESISAILRYYADIREQVNLAEVIHAASVMNLSLAEFLNLKDAAAEGVRIFFENLTERLSLSDSAAAMFIHALALAESFNVADQEKAALTFNLSVTDRFQLTDALAAIFRFGLVITENMTVGEIIVGTATSATITIARGKASIFKIGVTAQIADKPGKGEVH